MKATKGKKMRIRKKIIIMLVAIFAISLVALGTYAGSAYFFSTSEFAKTFKNFKGLKSNNESIKDNKPISILLMGVDTGTNQRTSTWSGNSDSMLVVTINPKTKKTTMTSLERDIYIKLTGPKRNDMDGVAAKLNAAYASGGAEMALMTVNDLLNMKIDYYMQINMQGLIDLVEAVGGITVTNHFSYPISIEEHEPDYKATVEPGTHKINGEQALVYSRMRYDDPEGDYGRQKRQREVIQKVMKKILSLNSVTSYRKILSAVSNNMQTNIEINSSTIPSLLGYSDSLHNVKSYQLRGDGQEIDGVSYQLVSHNHLLKVQNRIKKALGQETKTKLKTTAITAESYYGYSATSSEETSVSSSAVVSADNGYSGTRAANYNDSPASSYSPYSRSYANNSVASSTPASTYSSYENSQATVPSASTDTSTVAVPNQ